jgi:6-phosphogluconolactonase
MRPVADGRRGASRGYGRGAVSGPERLIVEDGSRLAEAAAEWIAAAAAADIRARGGFSLALAGGATPRPVYERLARDDLAGRVEWDRVAIFFGDERSVPPSDRASNYRMAAAALLDRVPIPKSRIHRMEAERADLEAAARDYERSLPEHLDLLLLGMGADGHTASLFPGSPALEERARRVVPVTVTVPPRLRLTITPAVIAAARRVAVLVAGAEKAATVVRVLEGPPRPRELPAQLALKGLWFLDHDAAARLARATA